MEKLYASDISIFKSIKTKLLFSFLLLALMPLSIALWISYKSSSDSVHKTIQNELKYSSPLSVKFIRNWFEYRTKDISNLSKSDNTVLLMDALNNDYVNSTKTLKVYTQSTAYTELVNKHKDFYILYSHTYHYVHDIFLIDLKGNILFSMLKESDFSTNLLNGPYATSRFATSFAQVLRDKKIHFSDLQRYAPSDNKIFGFMSAPILDSKNELIGVLSIQIKPDKILENFQTQNVVREGMSHYLIGKDGILRSPITTEKEILVRKINTKQVESYLTQPDHPKDDDNIMIYAGPNGKKVVGIHHDMNILGVDWALITEMDDKVILASTQILAKQLLTVMAISTLLIILTAWYIANKITLPLQKLSSATLSVAKGEEHSTQEPYDYDNDEIGRLAASFNKMFEQLKERSIEIHQALHALKEQKLALDAHAIVSITDVKGSITFVNQKFINISGYNKGELLGKNLRLLSSEQHDREFWQEMYYVITHKGIWHNEVCNRAKDGHLYWVETTILPFLNEKGEAESYISISTDITDRKIKEKQLVQQSHLAQMGEMISMIAHQWRQPLSAISAVAIQMRLAIELDKFQFSSEEESKRFSTFFNKEIGDIDNYVATLSTTIDDFRNFYKPGKLPVKTTIEQPVNKALKIMQASISKHGIELKKELKSTRRLLVFDSEMMQVMLNIFKNSLDNFIERQTLDPAITITTQDSENSVELKICDNGGGIPEEIISKVFEPYFSTKNDKNGTGLGLYMSKTIIEEHHQGTLDVENQDGGVCFTIRLDITP